jgi:hypothetical protein
MSVTLSYRKYATPSLSTYPRLNHYNTAHIIKNNLGTSSFTYPSYAPSLAEASCHRGRETGVAGVDKGQPDLALARIRIRLVVIGAKVGDLNLAYTIIEAVLSPSADMLSMNRRGSSSG